ncbi:MAG TPA: FlgO family outer membrane protein [Blastocatellia bacterium]|nr:FlgO family outer membrane protein [Blastocatellia bacterium]
MIGETISHYRILERLGAGGMGEVYKAEDTRLHRPVALKVMLAGVHRNEEARHRFLREARAASSLNHPNIATIYEIDEFERDGETHSFIAMEYVPGKTLSEYARARTLSVAQKLEIIEQAADALAEAHNHGIVHRDIKSSNILIADNGRVKVLDFGLAKLMGLAEADGNTVSEWRTEMQQTLPGRVMGTLAYMSPEQMLGRDVDHRSDIFSLGIVAYELLTGRLPFEGRTSLALADSLLHADPPPLVKNDDPVMPELDRIVRKMLARDRQGRYQRLREVIAEINALRFQMANPYSGTLHLPAALAGPDPFRTSPDPYQTNPGFSAPLVSSGLPGTRTLNARTGKSIAVMNFVNITRNPDDEWLGTGMAETVTADLKNIEGVTVIGRELIYEVMRNLSADRKSDFDEKFATQVGREVGARYILGGGYQRIGEQLRVTARVVAVESGEIISTVKLDGRMSDLFDLQDKIVYELSRNLNLRLHSGEQAVIEQDETQVMEAYEAFTRGVIQLRDLNRDAMDQARALFEKAVTLDPRYARAHAALGLAYHMKAQFFAQPELFEQAINSYQKAIELNPMIPDAYSGLGMTFTMMGREEEAVGAIRRALAFAPNNAEAHAALARVYMLGRGDFQAAVEEFEKALAINPKAGWVALQLAHCCAYTGDYERGEKAARLAIRLQESYMSGTDGMQIVGAYSRLGYICYLQGRYDDAVARLYEELVFLRKVDHGLRERVSIEVNQRLTSAYVRQGNPEEARRTFEKVVNGFNELLSAGADEPFTRYYVACACAVMGERDQALEHLEKAASRRRAYTVERMKREPDFESLRDDERFKKLTGN